MTRSGLHHVTAFAGGAMPNKAFHTGVLGLRLVKTTVNFDDPGTYHLYYGDAAGSPGTILTFFPIPGAAPGRLGSGETSETAFQVPVGSLGFWRDRLAEAGVAREASATVFGDPVLRFSDPDGLTLALVEAAGPPEASAMRGGVPAEHAICGLHGVTLTVGDTGPTAAVLTDVLGFTEVAREGACIRYRASAAVGCTVTLLKADAPSRGRPGAGSVHHVAFRAADDAAQAAMAARLHEMHGIVATEQRDRTYFRSIYFREPGGVLFEIATDAPGFVVDEAPDRLGETLKLPASLEASRERITRALPPLTDVA